MPLSWSAATLPPVVAEVQFKGNDVIQQTALQAAVAGAAVGVPFQEERFRQILDMSVRPLYEARSRIQVKFPRITAERAADVSGLRVTVEVEEGPPFDLGAVTVQPTVIDSDALLKAGRFKPGEPADFEAINAGIERMRTMVRRQGYLQAKAATERKINEAKKTVDVHVRIDPGERYTFGKLTVQGLDIQTEPVIRRIWTMKPGQPFNPEYPDFFLERVRQDGLFDNLGKTKATVKIDEESKTADVTLEFAGETSAAPLRKIR